MGCILACLRFKDNRKKRNKAQLKSSPVPSKTKDPLLSEDQFVSVFISEGSTREQVADINFEDNIDKDIFDSELKDEVKILKSCGAILETPAELRKTSEKLIALPPNKDISSSDSSCIPDTLIKKLVWEEKKEYSEFSQNSVAGSNFGEHQSQGHNDSASKTASFVPGTCKLVLDEEHEDSSFGQHSSAGFIFGVHQAQKHDDCTLSSASQRESAYLESGSGSAVLDASPSHDDTESSVCFGSARHEREIESSAELAATLDVSPSQNDTQMQVHSSKDVCFESVTHNPRSELWLASRVLDDSPSHDDTKGSVCFRSAKHDPEIESSAESAATLDASPSQNGTQIQELGLKDVCLESVTRNPGSESEMASGVLDDSPSHDDTEGSVCFRSAKHDPEIESIAESAATLDASPSQNGTRIQVHSSMDVCLESVTHIPGSESGFASRVLDDSPSHDDTRGSVCFGNAKHDPEIESIAESAVTLDASPSQNDPQIQVHSLKDVCLESVTHNPGSESGIVSRVLDDSPSQDGTQIQALGGKNSPYATPLQLTDEMGTPCTLYPSTCENLRRKNARVRNQYVYPVINPVENLAQLEVQQTPVMSSSNNQNDKRSPDRDEFDKENYSSVKKLRSLTPLSNSRWKVTSNLENPQVDILSLSQWLKHPPRDDEKKYCLERTPDVERPIFGVVAMHWNEEDPSKISSKLWGGNGIPNTTTKYKEDQKVCWHATPFEERLDKALSNDKLFPRRKVINRNLVAFNSEDEESNDVILG